jgi:hypothetical protein
MILTQMGLPGPMQQTIELSPAPETDSYLPTYFTEDREGGSVRQNTAGVNGEMGDVVPWTVW